MIKFVFFDLDNTLFDFDRSERECVKTALESFGVSASDKLLDDYNKINVSFWQRAERGEMTVAEVKLKRFETFFDFEGIKGVSPEDVNGVYERLLENSVYLMRGAKKLLDDLLKKGCRLFVVTNGTAAVQHGRLSLSGVEKCFEQVFISQDVGFTKPDKRFFEACFARIDCFDKRQSIIVGDSLSSDVLGGENVGVKTIWLNSRNETCDLKPTAEARTLAEVAQVVESF